MSHTSKIELQLKDKEIIEKAAESLGLRTSEGTFSLFSSKEKGIAVFLKGWRYPIVIKEDGSVAYDNYNGAWGDMKELNKFKNRYALEKAVMEARRKGYRVQEKKLNGKTRLILTKF